MHCFHCLCPLDTCNCTITGLVCVYLKCRFNEFSLSTMTAIVFWMEIEQSDVFFSSVSIKAWKSYFKYTHTAIYKADLETKGWRGKWKRHHKELPAWTSIRNVLSLLPLSFLFLKRSLFIAGIMAEVDLWPVTEASSWVWLWKSAIHLHHSKHTNGISPIWPSTPLFFSSGYDVITVWGWKYSRQVKIAKFSPSCRPMHKSLRCYSSLCKLNKFECSLMLVENTWIWTSPPPGKPSGWLGRKCQVNVIAFLNRVCL